MALKVNTRQIWVTFQREGIHLYHAAIDDPALATGKWDDVSFLGYAHRHIFHFRVSIDVQNNDTDIEFLQFKRWLESLYSVGPLALNHRSWELIAEELAASINQKYPGRNITVSVAEDTEDGATMTFNAT